MRYVICAAIRCDHKVWLGKCHADIMQVIRSERPDVIKISQDMQGFIGNHGEFLSRAEAAEVAFNAGQIKRWEPGQTIISEELDQRLWALNELLQVKKMSDGMNDKLCQAEESLRRINDESFVEKIAKILHCLPSYFVNGNRHIIAAAEKLQEQLADCQKDLQDVKKRNAHHEAILKDATKIHMQISELNNLKQELAEARAEIVKLRAEWKSSDAEYRRGVEEGKSSQAILEIQGRQRFLDDLYSGKINACPNCPRKVTRC